MIRQLAEQGFAIVDGVLPDSQLQTLRHCAQQVLATQGKVAGTGRGRAHAVNDAVRQDHIAWLDQNDQGSAGYLEYMEQLRVHLNQQLLLGLFTYECHFASYQSGAFYRKHLDAFKGQRNRVLSTVYYLNTGWQSDDGGELLIYRSDGQTVVARVSPIANRLVLFLSEEFPHEVLPAAQQRLSIAGWFAGA